MSKRPRNPSRPRVPGTFRTHERKGPDPNAEPQRIVLYLPIAALDRAERQSLAARSETLQRYCEDLLLRAIDAEDERRAREAPAVVVERPDAPRTVADDPDYLDEWTAVVLDGIGGPGAPAPLGPPAGAPRLPGPRGPEPLEPIVERPAEEVALRHAGLIGDDPDAFLPALRRGGPVSPGVGPELLRALVELEAAHRGASTIDRRLGYALHRLAFEGEILASEGALRSTIDEATIDLLRLVQEAVDRVLSGQDIRYYTSHDPSAPSVG